MVAFLFHFGRVISSLLSGNVHQQDGPAWALHARISQILASGLFGLFFLCLRLLPET